MYLSPHRILCVDDDSDSCELITLMVQNADENWRVITAGGGNDALQLIAERPFDLYILDFRLPEMSGIELCRLIRRTDLHTPIVFFTGMSREVDAANALEAGATKFLVKPTDLDVLTQTIEELLNQKTMNAESRNPAFR